MAKQSRISFSVPDPCSVTWNEMSPVDTEHRHCSSCDKVITDFSKMSDDELMLYFRHNHGKICGMFAKDQLNRPIKLISEKTQKAGWWRTILFIPLALFNKSAKAQLQENISKQPDSVSMVNDSLTVNHKIADVLNDSTKNPDSTGVASSLPADSISETNSRNKTADIATKKSIHPVSPTPVFTEVTQLISGDIIQTTTMGICSSPVLPEEPEYIKSYFFDRFFSSLIIRKWNEQQIAETDPLKQVSDKPQEKPNPQQPALPASDEFLAIMPSEKRKGRLS